MKFPLLNTFQVDESTVSFLNRKFEEYSNSHSLVFPSKENDNYFITPTGVHTQNMCAWNNDEYQDFLNTTLIPMCAKELGMGRENVKLRFTHFFDYREGGYVKPHTHCDCEDYVMFIYTKTCSSGHTIFYLNPINPDKTKVQLKPTSGLCAFFAGTLLHEAAYTNEPKRIFVVGVKIKTM